MGRPRGGRGLINGGLHMSRPIEDYALVGDLQSAALLGDERSGYWQIAPAREITRVWRRYRPHTLVLETEFSTASGVVRLIDCMPPRAADPVVIRPIEGVAGRG